MSDRPEDVIAVCSSAQQTNIQGLLDELHNLDKFKGVLRFEFVQLPYNDLDNYRLRIGEGHLIGLILCHSIHNRRFAITDVLDALYDKFLPHARDLLG